MVHKGPENLNVITNFSLEEARLGRVFYYESGQFQYPGNEILAILYDHSHNQTIIIAIGHTLNRSSGPFSSPTEYIPTPPRWLVMAECRSDKHNYVEACKFYSGGDHIVHLCLNCLASKSTTRQ